MDLCQPEESTVDPGDSSSHGLDRYQEGWGRCTGAGLPRPLDSYLRTLTRKSGYWAAHRVTV